MSNVKECDIEKLDFTCAECAREKLDEATVEKYSERIKEGDEFPPMKGIQCGKTIYIWDGRHRGAAYLDAGIGMVPVETTKGTREEAEWLALGANKRHGMPMSQADKRHCVDSALSKHAEKSDRSIADHIGVSATFVGERRKLRCPQTTPELEPPKRVGSDGKSYPAQKSRGAAVRDFFGGTSHQREPGDESEPSGADPVVSRSTMKPEKPAKATADLAESYVDDNGAEVPESLFPVWRERDTYMRICDDLKTIGGQIRELGKTPAGRGCNAVAKQADEAGKALALLMPSVVSGKSWKAIGDAK